MNVMNAFTAALDALGADTVQRDYALAPLPADEPVRPRPRFVALDLETTSLDTARAFPLEVAAVEYEPAAVGNMGATVAFVPHHGREDVWAADPEALQVNRYYERGLFKNVPTAADTSADIDELLAILDGAHLVGANPAYDAAVLGRYLVEVGAIESIDRVPWRFRLYDVEAATSARLGLDYVPGLSKCRELWDLPPVPDKHTALADTIAALDVFHAIRTAPF